MKARLAVCLPVLAGLGGCGLINHMHSVAWTASLDRAPEAHCVQEALAPLPDVFRIDLKDRPGGFVVGVYLKPRGQSDAEARDIRAKVGAEMKRIGIRDYRDFADISIIIAPNKRGNFTMGYMGWPAASDPREMSAQEIIQKLADSCIPGLMARVKENHDSEWLPYAFNI